ncbi:tRNA-specific adenosine deaminase subunit tad3 [Coemansia erecta]|uniref:tRNA-specific adenosine deaminase subunit tad3 n=1 Tax=Coemansia erecta TaxID=147472 RepID=A0A9W7XY70_9FUNG|nr:tRNA-specific adenosine deaminase subunit tad3 [Coemansia erecta]
MTLPAYSIDRVPIEEEQQKLTTTSVYTVRVPVQQTSSMLKLSQRLPPLTNLAHIKRVRPTATPLSLEEQPTAAQLVDVVLCQCAKITLKELQEKLPAGLLPVQTHEVPAAMPYTRAQFDEWKRLWPVTFRPPLQLRELQNLDPKEQAYVERMMRLAQEQRELCVGASRVGVVVADPRQSHEAEAAAVVARAHDTRERGNPLRHAVMHCIGLVADAEVHRRKRSLPDKEEEEGGERGEGYLCAGLDVFSTKEPCVMCCMALVHSRVGRLFFVDRDAAAGGISRYAMHARKALNHHFTTYHCRPAGGSGSGSESEPEPAADAAPEA